MQQAYTDALEKALGRVVADMRREVETRAAEGRAVIAELQARHVALEADVRAAVAARLTEVRDGEQGPPGEVGPPGERGEPGQAAEIPLIPDDVGGLVDRALSFLSGADPVAAAPMVLNINSGERRKTSKTIVMEKDSKGRAVARVVEQELEG